MRVRVFLDELDILHLYLDIHDILDIHVILDIHEIHALLNCRKGDYQCFNLRSGGPEPFGRSRGEDCSASTDTFPRSSDTRCEMCRRTPTPAVQRG